MHNQIMQPDVGLVVDHINGDGLDNRRENLRVCTVKQNCMNRIVPPGKWGRGVVPGGRGENRRYAATHKDNGRTVYLGWFDTPEEAAGRRREWELEHFGAFSPLVCRSA